MVAGDTGPLSPPSNKGAANLLRSAKIPADAQAGKGCCTCTKHLSDSRGGMGVTRRTRSYAPTNRRLAKGCSREDKGLSISPTQRKLRGTNGLQLKANAQREQRSVRPQQESRHRSKKVHRQAGERSWTGLETSPVKKGPQRPPQCCREG